MSRHQVNTPWMKAKHLASNIISHLFRSHGAFIQLILDKWVRPAEHLVLLIFLSRRFRVVRWHRSFLFRDIKLIFLELMQCRNILLVISLSRFMGRHWLFSLDVVELMRAEWKTKYLAIRSANGGTLDLSPRVWSNTFDPSTNLARYGCTSVD